MSECMFYQYKEGDYHCSRANHDIGDVDFVRKYCWGSCGECPVFNGEQGADHHRGTDECIYYCMKGSDAYCQKAGQYIDSDRVHSCCWGYHYRDCHVYTDSEPEAASSRAEAPGADTAARRDTSVGSADSQQSSSPASSRSTSAASDDGESDASFLFLMFGLLGAAMLAVGSFLWKALKTSPFWGPYAFTVLLPLLMALIMMPSTVVVMVPVVGVVAGLSLPLYLVLHTVLLVKCKKRQENGKYRPIYISFLLFVLFFMIALCIPAVIYQIVWLVRDKKKQTGGADQSAVKQGGTEAPESVAEVDGQRVFCPECGHAAAPGERFCKHCGAKLHES